MALNYHNGDFARDFNSVYNIVRDMSGSQKTTIHVVAPIGGRINLSASNDGGAILAIREGSPQTAQNFVPISATNLTTGVSSPAIYGAGLFQVDINAQYLRLDGAPASAGTFVYKLFFNDYKIQ